MSAVEAWASTPVGLADPPRLAEGSVDANRLRQYEWHGGFLDRGPCGDEPNSGLMRSWICIAGPIDAARSF
jgi:hypothetical protein